MGKFEERNNNHKEEILEFGKEGSNNIRMLGSYMGFKEDVNQRVRRGGAAWNKVKRQLKGSKLPKKVQARIVEACVESTMLFDAQTRTWQVREIKRIQSFVDRAYRYIWSKKNSQPLRQMQAAHKNMQDLRNELGVKSIRVKIEKRVLERIGHVMRMDDTRITKAIVLGWMKDLEDREKVPGKKRKTILYWKKLLREVGIDYTNINDLTQDRKSWKALVMERVDHIHEWEKKGGNENQEERGERNVRNEDQDLTCDYEGCGRVCLSKAGLVNHRRLTHEKSNQKKMFTCEVCQQEFQRQAQLTNHLGICQESERIDDNQVRCNTCNKVLSKTNFRRHMKQIHGDQQVPGEGGPRKVCEGCGQNYSKANIAKHKRLHCPGGAVH